MTDPVTKCARTACDAPAHPLFVHRDTGLTYCVRCARRINEANPGLIPWPTQEQILQHKET